MLVVYFDSHVELLTVLQAANPTLWAPRNSKIATTAGLMYNQLYPGSTTYHLGTILP
jgi:hypothetical protein